MKKAREHSPHASNTPSQETQEYILSIIQANPETTNTQIRDLLESQYSKKLQNNIITQYTRKLRDEGKILQSQRTNAIQWRIAPQT